MQIHPDQLVEHFKDLLVENHFMRLHVAQLEAQLASLGGHQHGHSHPHEEAAGSPGPAAEQPVE